MKRRWFNSIIKKWSRYEKFYSTSPNNIKF